MILDNGKDVLCQIIVDICIFEDNQVPMRLRHGIAGVAGNDHTVDFRMVLVNFAKKFNAGKARHIVIGNDDGGPYIAPDCREGFAGISVDDYVSESGMMQVVCNDACYVGQIVDNDNAIRDFLNHENLLRRR